MKFIDIEGEPGPHIVYNPYVYSTIVECSNHFTIFRPNGEVEIKIKNEKYRKEIHRKGR